MTDDPLTAWLAALLFLLGVALGIAVAAAT